MTKKYKPWKGRARTTASVIKNVKKDNFASAICPTNLEEQKERFLSLGKTPEFTHRGNEDELEALYQKPRSEIRFDLLGEAIHILKVVKEKYGDAENYYSEVYGPRVTKDEATDILIDYLKENHLDGAMSVIWCKDLPCSGRMMWQGPHVKFKRPEARKYSMWIKDSMDNHFVREQGMRCLCDHEIGTHFFRSYNDGLQPWYSDRIRFGIRGMNGLEHLRTEEGLAAVNTLLNAKDKLLWGPALLYYIACKASEMTFKQLFEHLAKYVENPEWRWRHCVRVKRGLLNPNDIGGYGKDQCYFEGAVTILRNYQDIDFKVLMSGKICYDECSRVKRLARLNCIQMPAFMRNQDAYKKILKHMLHVNGLHLSHSKYKAPQAYMRRLKKGRRIGDTRGALNQVRSSQVEGRGTGEVSEEGDMSDTDMSEFYGEEKLFQQRFESSVNDQTRDSELEKSLKNRSKDLETACYSIVSNPRPQSANSVHPDIESMSSVKSESDVGKDLRCLSRASIKSHLSLRSNSLASRCNRNTNADIVSVLESLSRPGSSFSGMSSVSSQQSNSQDTVSTSEASYTNFQHTTSSAPAPAVYNHKPQFPFQVVSPGFSRTPRSTMITHPNVTVIHHDAGGEIQKSFKCGGSGCEFGGSRGQQGQGYHTQSRHARNTIMKSFSEHSVVEHGPERFIYPDCSVIADEVEKMKSLSNGSNTFDPDNLVSTKTGSQVKLLKRRVQSATNKLLKD